MRDIDNGAIPDDVLVYWEMQAYLKAEGAGFPRPLDPTVGSCWWQKDGRHFIDPYDVERYIPFDGASH